MEKPPPPLEPWFPQHVMRGFDDSRSLSPGQPRLWSKGGYRMGEAHQGKQLRAPPLHRNGVPECTTEGRRGVSGGGMGGERRSQSTFHQGITKTCISNSSFASPKMNWRENSPVVQDYNSVLPSSSAALIFFCLRSFPASESFPVSQLFASGGPIGFLLQHQSFQ